MGTRGLWNLYFAGKWYRFHDCRTRISSPGEQRTVSRIKSIIASLDNLKGWELVAFPSPLQSGLDYVYTINIDADILIITRNETVNGLFRPYPRQIPLSCLDESHELVLNSLAPFPGDASESDGSEVDTIPQAMLGRLDIQPGQPTALNELQFWLSLDYCFVWRYYIDDPTTWRYPSMAFNTIVIGLLRIAAWDLEVSSDTEIDYPLPGTIFPHWQAPETETFWFHGYLVVFHRNIDTGASISAAISKARPSLKDSRKDVAHLIILSLKHVAFVEISSASILTTRAIPFIVNNSALQCSPGFRLLCYIMSSNCWKVSPASREHIGVGLAPEILDLILGYCTSKNALALSRASFTFKGRYYSIIPQMQHLLVRTFKNSLACCGKNNDFNNYRVYCPCCYACRHTACIGLKPGPRVDPRVICSDCKDSKLCTDLVPGGISHAVGRYPARGCEVSVAGSPKVLRLRLSKPSHLRPELKLLGYLAARCPPLLVGFTIRFNGTYAGLAYGLDDS